MDLLFQLNIKDFDILLPNMKARLMSEDENAQMMIVERITNLLKDNSVTDRKTILDKLIRFDIMSVLFNILQSTSDSLLLSIFDLLSLVNQHRNFYEDHIAMDAVDSMLKIAICTIKSRTENTIVLEKLILLISDLLYRATEFCVDFDTVCVPQQMLFFLKSLMVDNASEHQLMFPGIILLNIVLENIYLEEHCKDDTVFQLCHRALNWTREIVEYSDDDVSISLAADALCGICASGTRFCDMDSQESQKSSDKVLQCRTDLTKAIYSAVMKTIIPYVKNTGLTQTDRVKFHRNLVTCLNNLYKLRSCSHDNLSNHLTANGYLKYFLILTTELPEILRRSTCSLLSRIITTLDDKSMSIGQKPEGVIGFSNELHNGLVVLPKDPQEWPNIITYQANSGTALLKLIYYHFHGTRENYMISLKVFAARILNLPESQTIDIQILKVLWFLFGVGFISHPAPTSEQNYARAVKRLTVALQCSKLNECYTHHIDLLHFCLKCAEIPKDLRSNVMNLWLIESDGDIKPLLTLDCDKIVRHCLLAIIQNGYPDSVINLAMKGIRELTGTENAKEIAEIAWHMLPNLLSSYNPEKDEHIKAVLELANMTKPDSLSLSCKTRCAGSLVNIVLRKEADVKLKSLSLMQAYILLVTTVTSKEFNVLEKYIGAPNFLEELHAQGFSVKMPEFSAVCLKLLAFIIRCQNKTSIQRAKALTIDVRSLADLLINTRKSMHASINGTQLVLELLTQNIDGSAVRLKEIASNTDEAREVINLYETLHIIHGKCHPTQRDTVYQCLSALLMYCHERLAKLMYHICTLMSNYDLVVCTLNTSHVSRQFLEFVSIWLRCRKKYCDDEGSWSPRSLCKTPFEESLDRITKYLDTVSTTRADMTYDLRYAMAQFKE